MHRIACRAFLSETGARGLSRTMSLGKSIERRLLDAQRAHYLWHQTFKAMTGGVINPLKRYILQMRFHVSNINISTCRITQEKEMDSFENEFAEALSLAEGLFNGAWGLCTEDAFANPYAAMAGLKFGSISVSVTL